jgi:hypothetical protein
MTLSAPLAAGTAQQASLAWQPFDFNGDGYRDLAVGAIGAFKGGVSGAGAVTVLYGGSSGLSQPRRQTIHLGLAWVPDVAEANDDFGYAVASGNFDGDGYADLAVGSPGEDPTASSWGGTVTLLFGGATGFSTGARYGSPKRDGSCNTFGGILTSGDFNADGYGDVAASSNCNAGTYVIYGGKDARAGGARMENLEPDFTLFVNQALATGDVNGDSYDDLAAADSRTDVPGEPLSRITLHLGGPAGLSPVPSQQVDDGFSVAIGDFDGDGFDDVVSGVYLDSSALGPPGKIVIRYGSKTGLNLARGSQTITQDTSGVPGSAEDGDRFGTALAPGDINGDGRDDLAVGVPAEDIYGHRDAGLVTVLYGSATGLRGAGAQQFHKNTPGISGAVGSWDLFGATVTLIDLYRDGRADLVIGAPWDGTEGLITLLRATSSGLTSSSAKTISGGSVGLTGSGPGIGSSASFGWDLVH